MLTKLYLDTTNPKIDIRDWNKATIILSVLLHTIIYVSFANIVSYIFTDKMLSTMVNIKLVLFLLIIMTLGFVARYYHVKDVYGAYNEDLKKTRKHLDNLYISWIFIS